ncbi:RsmB/NOP family class I SAM-dependent RNA methyltransferase [Ereboglobus luteus]|uniref:RNA methyltransferase n=1 Tax=Ereboglobus luteus TaxID=1796921 RepID=A0A2U8E6G5_9BACT|nr:RsmB/NOP family class I SAM-dependent RNA methyltransferase [Ereboglobus luteus]AWI10154.1 RNA methyltransferase [Ereboglobus luteus]
MTKSANTPDRATASAISHTARVLDSLRPGLHADTALRNYFAYWHRLGPREKRAISRATFAYFRWFGWLDRKDSPQKQIAGALDLQSRFDNNPASIKTEAIAARAIPEWSRDEVAWPAETLRLLQHDPVLWLRAKTSGIDTLAAQLGDCEPASNTPVPAPDAFRYTGRQDLFRTPQFHEGLFEIQDLASQLTGHACAPKPGQTWWDACAGEGGKTLHLAELMQNKGMLWASDRSFRRLQSLKRRAARAKVFNYRAAAWDGSAKLPTKTKFDGILLDAPCSGLGTWQRNPHARWTTTPDDVRELAAVQTQLLANVAGSLKPGGRLIYAVCTLTRSETTAIADAFTTAHADFEPAPVFAASGNPSAQTTLWPHEHDCNGMFIAAWRRK